MDESTAINLVNMATTASRSSTRGCGLFRTTDAVNDNGGAHVHGAVNDYDHGDIGEPVNTVARY